MIHRHCLRLRTARQSFGRRLCPAGAIGDTLTCGETRMADRRRLSAVVCRHANDSEVASVQTVTMHALRSARCPFPFHMTQMMHSCIEMCLRRHALPLCAGDVQFHITPGGGIPETRIVYKRPSTSPTIPVPLSPLPSQNAATLSKWHGKRPVSHWSPATCMMHGPGTRLPPVSATTT
jgi:hypothetical protein